MCCARASTSIINVLGENTMINAAFKLYERICICFYYLTNPRFFATDFLCLLQYAVSNPFSLCDNYNRLYPENRTQCYGETPLTTLKQVIGSLAISSDDTVYELGCGRGRTMFWLHHFIGCRVIGIDINPFFIKRAQRVKNILSLQNLKFKQSFMHKADLSDANLVYLYGTSLHDEYIVELVEALKTIPTGARLVSVSYSILDYASDSDFVVERKFKARFHWGRATVYVHRRI